MEDWPVVPFTPGAGHIAGAAGLIALGFLISVGVGLIGKERGEQEVTRAPRTESRGER